jgi:hypothetical protein
MVGLASSARFGYWPNGDRRGRTFSRLEAALGAVENGGPCARLFSPTCVESSSRVASVGLTVAFVLLTAELFDRIGRKELPVAGPTARERTSFICS